MTSAADTEREAPKPVPKASPSLSPSPAASASSGQSPTSSDLDDQEASSQFLTIPNYSAPYGPAMYDSNAFSNDYSSEINAESSSSEKD